MAALERGCAVSELRNLSDLIAPGIAGGILDRYDEELGKPKKAPASLRLMSLTLYVMARRHLRVPEDAMLALRNIIGEAGPEQFGMTEKNLEKIKSLTPKQFQLLFQLPATLLSNSIINIRKNRGKVSDLVNAQSAVAIAILLHAPLRGTNLRAIRLGIELNIPSLPGVEARLRFAPEAVKNNVRLDFPIPPDVAALIRAFVQEVMPEFPRSGFTPALFPGLKSETKGVNHLGSQIASRITKAIGLRLNQHLFRHLLAHIYLARNPGRYDVVQYLLGHKSVQTTKKYYCGAEIEAAIRDVTKNLADLKVEYGLDPNDMSKIKK
ncbi:site-specific integrase [Belnapia rosea]|uniref:site-specific integrase n=1 Tax=Belnapia rosea TaxID=938405 RepID=UPI0015A283EC|nr:site-specific integrase [Belnapia rosea]